MVLVAKQLKHGAEGTFSEVPVGPRPPPLPPVGKARHQNGAEIEGSSQPASTLDYAPRQCNRQRPCRCRIGGGANDRRGVDAHER